MSIRKKPSWLIKLAVLLLSGATHVLLAVAALADGTASGAMSVQNFVRKTARRSLARCRSVNSGAVIEAIFEASRRHHIDPLLITAVIENESGFSPFKRGSHGEIGLMQVKPSTGRWIARHEKLPWHGAQTLKDPAANIRIGVSYLAFLRDSVSSQSQLYLAAYNMGARNVRRAISRNVYPREYADRVFRHYFRYQTLL